MSTTNPYGIERADPSDSADLFAFLMPIYAENALQTVSAHKVASLVDRCVNMDEAIAGVIRGGAASPIVASIGLVIEEADYTDDKQIRAVWAFTHPDHRRENYLKKMIEFGKWCQESMQQGSDTPLPLVMQILTSLDLEAQMRAYQRYAPQVGALFTWGLVPNAQYDQLQLGTGRGHMGRASGKQHRVGLHRASPLLEKSHRSGRAS